MQFRVWYITVQKKAKINFFDNFLLSYNWPEFFQNFGISVPMKINNKKKNFFLYKECYFWVVAFLVLKELKNTHNTRFS